MKTMDRETVLEAFLQEHVLERWVDDIPQIEENFLHSKRRLRHHCWLLWQRSVSKPLLCSRKGVRGEFAISIFLGCAPV